MRKGEPKTSLGLTSNGIPRNARGPELPHASSTPIGTLPKGYPAPIHSPVAFEPFSGPVQIPKTNGGGRNARTLATDHVYSPMRNLRVGDQCEISGWETYRYTL